MMLVSIAMRSYPQPRKAMIDAIQFRPFQRRSFERNVASRLWSASECNAGTIEYVIDLIWQLSLAPLVKSPDSSLRPSPSNARTPALAPSRSNLSIARRTVPRFCWYRTPGCQLPARRPAAFAVVELDDVVAALQAQGFQRVGQHHQQFGIGGGRVAAHRVGVELGEFAIAARARLLVAPHRAI